MRVRVREWWAWLGRWLLLPLDHPAQAVYGTVITGAVMSAWAEPPVETPVVVVGVVATVVVYWLAHVYAEELVHATLSNRTIGMVMGFGAGALLSAIAYELIPESLMAGSSILLAVFFALGAFTFFGMDWWIDHRAGADRKDIEGKQAGSGSAIFIGTLLDNIPESIILGMSLALGAAINVAFLTAVFISNLPEGVAGSLNLESAGHSRQSIFWMWTWLVLISAICAGIGYMMIQSLPAADGRYSRRTKRSGLGKRNFSGGSPIISRLLVSRGSSWGSSPPMISRRPWQTRDKASLVRDIMKKKVITTTQEEAVDIAVRKLEKNNISALPVVDTKNHVIVMLTAMNLGMLFGGRWLK